MGRVALHLEGALQFLLSPFTIADVAHEGREDGAAVHRHRRDRKLDRELVALTVKSRDLHPRVEDGPVSRFFVPAEALEMSLSIPLRDDRLGEAPAQDFVVSPAE